MLCEPCHSVKTAKQDVPAIAKAKRREAKHIGATMPKGQIKSAGFQKVEKPPRAGAARIDKSAIPPLPRRNPFTGEIYE